MSPLMTVYLLNYIIIAILVAIVYSVFFMFYRAAKMVKKWEQREREFFDSVYFQTRLKEYDKKLSGKIPNKNNR